jgi:hypothetical protein
MSALSMKLIKKLKFSKDQGNSRKLKSSVMSSLTIKNGQLFSVFQLPIKEKQLMDTFNSILLKAKNNK